MKKVFGEPNTPFPRTDPPSLIIDSINSVPDRNYDDVEACYCGSGKYFKSCCGSNESRRKPPYGIFVIENYLDAAEARRLTVFAEKQEGKRLMVIDNETSTPGNIKLVEDERRITERVVMGKEQQTLNNMIEKAYRELPKKLLGREAQWFETPQLLRYYPGGHYIGHADSQNLNGDTQMWEKKMDRDLSLLIYLNNAFDGGEVFFKKFNFSLRPKAGMLVMFPSDSRYMHEAQTITQGVRYAVVSWAAVKGVPKVTDKPPPASFQLD